MSKILETRTNNLNLSQKQTADEIGCSDITIKRYKIDSFMVNVYNRETLKEIIRTPKDILRPHLV